MPAAVVEEAGQAEQRREGGRRIAHGSRQREPLAKGRGGAPQVAGTGTEISLLGEGAAEQVGLAGAPIDDESAVEQTVGLAESPLVRQQGSPGFIEAGLLEPLTRPARQVTFGNAQGLFGRGEIDGGAPGLRHRDPGAHDQLLDEPGRMDSGGDLAGDLRGETGDPLGLARLLCPLLAAELEQQLTEPPGPRLVRQPDAPGGDRETVEPGKDPPRHVALLLETGLEMAYPSEDPVHGLPVIGHGGDPSPPSGTGPPELRRDLLAAGATGRQVQEHPEIVLSAELAAHEALQGLPRRADLLATLQEARKQADGEPQDLVHGWSALR